MITLDVAESIAKAFMQEYGEQLGIEKHIVSYTPYHPSHLSYPSYVISFQAIGLLYQFEFLIDNKGNIWECNKNSSFLKRACSSIKDPNCTKHMREALYANMKHFYTYKINAFNNKFRHYQRCASSPIRPYIKKMMDTLERNSDE